MRAMRRAPHLAALACAALFFAPDARADAPTPITVDPPNERRGGFVIGLATGAGVAGSSGYPNDSNYIGVPSYYAASGLMAGYGGGLFIMGALTDYLSFGFWFANSTFENGSWQSKGQGGGLRLELFPLYGLGGLFRDLGAFTQVGIGATTLTYTEKSGISYNGVGSSIGAGVFYEIKLARALGGHFAIGPSLEYDAIISQPMERHGALLGARFLWYGGK
jgi:hypothetical protein